MFSFNEEELEREEPESSSKNYVKYLKKLMTVLVIFYLFTEIVLENFNKIGTKKIQTVGTDMKTFYSFDLEEVEIYKLLPFHWFVEINKQSVVDRMECLINKDSQRCFEQ